jgi:hypothetical protein
VEEFTAHHLAVKLESTAASHWYLYGLAFAFALKFTAVGTVTVAIASNDTVILLTQISSSSVDLRGHDLNARSFVHVNNNPSSVIDPTYPLA